MSHTPPPLPKPGSGAMKELWESSKKALDAPRTILVLEGALDRKALEEILQRHMKGAAARPGQMPRAELVGRLANAFHLSVEVATALMKELDKSCHKERHIVASIDESAVDERLSTYRALDFRRERARLIWALLRDGREAHRTAAEKVLVDAFAQIAKAEEAHAAAEAAGGAEGAPHASQGDAAGPEAPPSVPSGAPAASATPASGAPVVPSELKQRLTSYEKAIEQQQQQLQREVGLKEHVERERSELMVRVGQRERALREEGELRRAVESERDRLRVELKDAVTRLAARNLGGALTDAGSAELDRLRDKVRALEAKAERAERVGALEAEIEELKRAHDVEKRAWSRLREQLDEGLRAAGVREKSAHDKAAALRDELKVARRQLAGVDEASASGEHAALRTGVFVDAANLSASARRDFGSKLDYRALLAEVLDGRPKACAIAYVVRDGDESAYFGFANSLKDAGYELREKRPKHRSDGSAKADWDMGIAMEILDALDSLDVVVLCSGDGDFLPLVKRLQRERKRVEVAAFRAATDEALVKSADAFVPLDGRFRL